MYYNEFFSVKSICFFDKRAKKSSDYFQQCQIIDNSIDAGKSGCHILYCLNIGAQYIAGDKYARCMKGFIFRGLIKQELHNNRKTESIGCFGSIGVAWWYFFPHGGKGAGDK